MSGVQELTDFPAFRSVRPAQSRVAGSSERVGEGGTCGFCAS
jgi:hypothetical protein